MVYPREELNPKSHYFAFCFFNDKNWTTHVSGLLQFKNLLLIIKIVNNLKGKKIINYNLYYCTFVLLYNLYVG